MESNGFMIGSGIKEIGAFKVDTRTVGHPVDKIQSAAAFGCWNTLITCGHEFFLRTLFAHKCPKLRLQSIYQVASPSGHLKWCKQPEIVFYTW